MALKVFCGPFHRLEDAFVERLRALAPSADRRVAVVAPSRRVADRLQRLVAVERGLAVLGLRFHTFHSLALELAEESGALDRKVVGDGLFHDKLVDRVLRDKPKGRRFSRGLAAAYRSTVRDLIDAGVDPEQFGEHFEGLFKEGRDKRLIETLLDLQRDYLARLDEIQILPPSGLARLAAESVAGGRDASLRVYAEILYYGFYDLTGAQADLFQAVAGAHPCSAFFPFVPGHPGFEFAERFYEARLLVGGASPEVLEPEWGTRALGPALEGLFSAKTAVAGAPPLELVSASGARDELWAAAKRILELRKDGVAFADIGVVARTLGPYAGLVKEVFEANEVPFAMGCGEALLKHPIAKLSLGLLTLRRRDFPMRAVADIVESPYFNETASSGRRLVGDWTRLMTRLAVHSGWLQWEGKLLPATREDFQLYPHLVAEGQEGEVIAKESAAALWNLLAGWREALDGAGRKGWAAWADRARALLTATFEVPDGDPGRPAWDAVLEALSGFAEFDRAMPGAEVEEFLDAFEERLRRAEVEASGLGGGVRVLDAMDARGESFEVVLALGLQEGVFPRQVREDPLLPDSARVKLRDAAGYWIGPKLEGYAEERLLFTLLASCARKRVICLWQRSDEDGKAQVPSLYLRELCRAAGVRLEDARRVARQPYAKLEGLPPGLLSPREALLAGVEPAEGLYASCLERVAELDRFGEPGEMDGIVGPLPGFLDKLSRRGLSPTALETFSKCPFQFFASRVLGLDEPEEPSERGELARRARGELYHRALERFYSTPGWDAKGWEDALDRAFDAAAPEAAWRSYGLYPVLWEATRRSMRTYLKAFADLDRERVLTAELTPRLFEAELAAEVEGILLRGRADRIDSDGTRFAVVDYKTKYRDKPEKQVLKMRALQLPLYLELAMRSGKLGPAPEAIGAALHCIENGPKGRREPEIAPFDAEAWKSLRGGVLASVKACRGLIGDGVFLATKEDGWGGACAWCCFDAVCRKSHPGTARRAEESKQREAVDAARRVELPASEAGPAPKAKAGKGKK